MLSEHSNFWRGEHETELHIDGEWRKRFRTFPLDDPAVVQMISSSRAVGASTGTSLLYTLICDHLNKSLSTNRLRNRKNEAAANANPAFYDPVPGMADDEELETPEH